MKKYNYADEIIKDDNGLLPQSELLQKDPVKEKIVNEQDQQIVQNNDDDKNHSDKVFQAFEEGIRNDNISTEEEKEDISRSGTKKATGL